MSIPVRRPATRSSTDKLGMVSQSQRSQAESEITESAAPVGRFVSLAADYRIDIASSQESEQWLLTPLDCIIHSKRGLPEGALTNRALSAQQVECASTANCTTLSACVNGDNLLVQQSVVNNTTTGSTDDSLDPTLVAVLARIMVQRLASRQSKSDKDCTFTLSLPKEDESMKIIRVHSKEDVLKLFEPLLDEQHANSDVELVEMVDRHGSPLGMIPRPLVHTFNLLHRGIGMLIVNATDGYDPCNGKQFPASAALYVHRRTNTKKIFPSLYDMFVGGVSEAGEESSMTAAREVAEELGLVRALTSESSSLSSGRGPLSEPLFCCNICTAYNRCVVTVYCYAYNDASPQNDVISWQKEEVAWGAFVPYSIVEKSARLCTERMVSCGTWPGELPPVALTIEKNNGAEGNDDNDCDQHDWMTWDYVPDGLLVWEAWLQWHSQQQEN